MISPKIGLILACEKSGGIGYNDELPWQLTKEFDYYKSISKNALVICGKGTFAEQNLFKNHYAKFFVVSRSTTNSDDKNKDNQITESGHAYQFYTSVEQAIQQAKTEVKPELGQKILIIGGAPIYDYCFREKLADYCLITRIDEDFKFDKKIALDDLVKNYSRIDVEKSFKRFNKILADDETKIVEPMITIQEEINRKTNEVVKYFVEVYKVKKETDL